MPIRLVDWECNAFRAGCIDNFWICQWKYLAKYNASSYKESYKSCQKSLGHSQKILKNRVLSAFKSLRLARTPSPYKYVQFFHYRIYFFQKPALFKGRSGDEWCVQNKQSVPGLLTTTVSPVCWSLLWCAIVWNCSIGHPPARLFCMYFLSKH